ncbi:MAG: T9SS type A sorting domain-containing protein [Lewinellaceae bacterium]|nr:T9SS type A sorting domain-containing protein [Saprospiraceae bacterium]MCB9341164.1 T9SS type A sorting domain-containing protein [Lewinellaceae bacterium]
MMKFRLLLLFACLSWQLFAQLTIKVTSLPVNTPPNDDVYIAGSFQNWNPGDPNYVLTNNGDGTRQITINPPVGLIEYKFTRSNSWTTVEGNANGTFLDNRTFTYNGVPQTIEVSILTWEDLSAGSGGTAADNVFVLDNSFYMPELNRSRRVWIYLPPDYSTSSKYYPVLYMHDGQNLFDVTTSFSGEWEVDETLNNLFSQGDYGCIVVAIDNGGASRADEYAPWVNTSYNAGGEGDEYMDFIVTTLKPQVDANYRTLSGRDYTGVMGSSLGALISQYGIMEYQEDISKAGILSPAFWFNPEIFDFCSNTTKVEPLKIYMVASQNEGQGSVAQDANHMEMVLQGNGFTSTELKKVITPYGDHNEAFWAMEFGPAYQWLFGGVDFTSASEVEATLPHIYPNPTDSILKIENLPDLRKPTYQVVASDGKMVQSGKLVDNSINVSTLQTGLYTLQVFSKKKVVFTGRFVVKH